MLEKLKELSFADLEALRNFFYDEMDLAKQEVEDGTSVNNDAVVNYQARYDTVRQAMEAKFNSKFDSGNQQYVVGLDLNPQ